MILIILGILVLIVSIIFPFTLSWVRPATGVICFFGGMIAGILFGTGLMQILGVS